MGFPNCILLVPKYVLEQSLLENSFLFLNAIQLFWCKNLILPTRVHRYIPAFCFASACPKKFHLKSMQMDLY